LAQKRALYVPADGNVYEYEDGELAPADSAAIWVAVYTAPLSNWRMVGKDAEVALPMFDMDAESVTGVPAVAEVGVTPPAVISGAGAGPTERLLEQLTVVLNPHEVMTTLAVLVPVVGYALVTELAVPERPSVPLQEYV
jgi:hypothetical protein